MSGVDIDAARRLAEEVERLGTTRAAKTIRDLCDEVAHRGDLIRVLADSLTHWVEELDRDPCRTESGAVDVFAYLVADAEQVGCLAAVLDGEDGDR